MVMMPKERKPNGFTLIELVVAIAVLSILAGIAIMRYIDATTEAKRNTCLANRTISVEKLLIRKQRAQTLRLSSISFILMRCLPTRDIVVLRTAPIPLMLLLWLSAALIRITPVAVSAATVPVQAVAVVVGGGTGSTVTASTLGATNWSDKLTSAADSSGGVSLTRGSVFTDSTGVFFVAWGSWLNKETGVAKPTLAEAAASGLGLVKVDTANIWTSANTTTTSNGQTVWTTLPQAGAVYSDGTNYYIHSQSSGNEYTDVNPPTNGNWVKVTNN